MIKLNIVGYILGTSGYANHTRQRVNALYKLNPEISLKTQLPMGYENLLNHDELKMVRQKPFIDANILAETIPTQWPLDLCKNNSKLIGCCVWEGSNIPESWFEYIADDRVNKIVVPSDHTRWSIINTINDITEGKILPGVNSSKILKTHTDMDLIKEKINIVSSGVDTKIFKPRQKKFNDGIFRFIANKGWCSGLNDRGGIQYLIKAFNEEFNRQESVELMVKINPAYRDGNWDLAAEINNLNLRDNGGKLSICLEEVALEKLSLLYNCGDVFVSPNMSEGFGLPIAEAMACGLPAITTGYGGQTDFVNEKNGWLIDYQLVDVDWDIRYKGVRWAKPDMMHLRKLMRHAFEHEDEVIAKGTLAMKNIERLTWENSAKCILKLFNE